jgi:hypothetical protein
MAGLSLGSKKREEAMTDRMRQVANIGKQGSFSGGDADDKHATVAAVIDPATGRVLSREAKRQEDQCDETMVFAGAEQMDIDAGKQMAKYIPAIGKCTRNDKTVAWRPRTPQPIVRVTSRLESYRSRLGRRGQCVVSVGLFVLLLVGIVGAICQAGKPDRERGVLHPPVGNRANRLSPPIPNSRSNVSPASFSVPATAPSSKIAADALVEGRLDEALNHYRVLNAYHPQEKPYALIVDILTESKNAGLR